MAQNKQNMNGMQVYIPNGYEDDGEKPRRSTISGFGADGKGNFTFYGDEDNALRAGFDGIMANANAQKADRARRGRATLGSMVGHAMDNGGMVPRELGAAYGQELGMNGPAFGTLAKDGTFISLGIGQNGNIQPTGLVKSFDVLGSMVQSGDWKNAQKYAKKYLDGKYTPEQIARATGFTPQWVNETQTKEDANNKKIVLQGLFDIAKQQKDRPPMTAREAWQRGMSDPKFIEAWMTKPNPDALSAEQNPRVPLETEEEVAAAMKKFEAAYGELESGGGKEAMNPFQERILTIADRVLGPAPVDPNVAEMRQRAAAQANIIDAAGGRQTGFYYRNRSGGLTATNGYVVDGKAYDRYGNLMQGVQPLDYQGNPLTSGAQSAQGEANGAEQPNGEGTVNTVTPDQRVEAAKAALASRGQQTQEQPSAPLSQPVTSLETPTATAQTATLPADDNAERERRLRNGARMRERIAAEEAESARRERPLSETPIRELPGAALRKAADWVVEDVKKTGQNIADVTDVVSKAGAKMSADISSQLAEMGGMTPSEIAQNAKNEIKMYLDSIKRAFQAQMKSDASARNGSGDQADSYAEWEKLSNELEAVLNDTDK